MKYSILCYLYIANIFAFLYIAKYCELCDENTELYMMSYVFIKTLQLLFLQTFDNAYTIITLSMIVEIIAGNMFIAENCDLLSQQIFLTLYWFSVFFLVLNIFLLLMITIVISTCIYFMIMINKHKMIMVQNID